MPAYANALFRDERPILIVTISEADTEQYGMNYMNIFKILCGLIQTSLLRAVDHMELTEEQNYYPGTNVLRPGRFMQILAVHEEMQERGVAEHVLVRFRDTDRQRLSDSLSRIIRTTDVIGEGEDGRLYLILAQANTVSFRFVENRLATSGLSYEITQKRWGDHMLLWILVIIHLILCLIAYLLMKAGALRSTTMIMPPLVFVPVLGFVCLAVLEWETRVHPDTDKEVGIEKLKINDEIYRSILMEEDPAKDLMVPLMRRFS